MANVKVAVLERDGVEYQDAIEYTLLAEDVPYDSLQNVFEAISGTKAKLRDPRLFAMNGVVSNGDFISANNLIADYKYVFAEAQKLIGFEWSCGNGNGKDFDLEFYKNGVDPTDKFYTYEVRNSTNDYEYITGLNYTFSAGDYMRVKYIDQGTNVSDFAGRFTFEVTS